jgi:hypothetical protein
MKYIRHQECEVEINQQKIFAKNAKLTSTSNATEQRVYGGGLRYYAASSPLSASVDFDYYITGKEDPIGSLTGDMSCSGRFCGIEFSGAYLSNYSIRIEAYKPVQFHAGFVIYSGHNGETQTGSFEGSSTGLANGAYTELLNFNKNSIGLDFPQSISYDVECERTPNYVIGSEFPSDVRYGSVKRKMSVEGENIGSVISFSGKDFGEMVVSPRNIDYAARGQTLRCRGIITSQNLSVSSNGLLMGSVEAMESLR